MIKNFFADNNLLEKCIKYGTVSFEASKDRGENKLGGGSLSVLTNRLEKKMVVDKINIAYELLHPETKLFLKNSIMPYYTEDDLKDLKSIPHKQIDELTKTLQNLFDKNEIKYISRNCTYRSSMHYHAPIYWDSPTGDLLEDYKFGIPQASIKFQFDINDGEKLIKAIEESQFSDLSQHKKIIVDIKQAIILIKEYSLNNDEINIEQMNFKN